MVSADFDYAMELRYHFADKKEVFVQYSVQCTMYSVQCFLQGTG